MKIYKMSDDERASLNKGKVKTSIILLILLLIPITFFSYYNGFKVSSLIFIALLLLQALFSISSTGIHHFELDSNSNTLYHYKKELLKNSFDLKKVRVVASVGENQSTLVIKDDGDTKGNYHSEILGIAPFNELIKDISAINDGTYQS